MYLLINFLRQKSVDCSFLRREVDSYGYELAAVGSIGLGIALFFYLLEGSLGRAVELELDDIDVSWTLHHAVNAPFACLLLCHGAVECKHLDDEIEGVLEISLTLHRVLLALQSVGDP